MKRLSVGLLGVVGVALAAWGAGQWRWSGKSQALLDRLESSRERAPQATVDLRELDGLPPPVARHLRQALPEGATLIRAVDVVHRGTFNMGQAGEQWRPFTSRQRVVTRRPGFVWDARISMGPGVAVHVHDAYVDGEGILEPAILGLYSLMQLRDRGGEVARGELMRFFAEAAWYPTALLPSQGVRWEPIDDTHARGTLVDGPLTLPMTFGFGADGLLASMRVEDRGRTVDGTVVPTPWEGRMSNYQRRDGYLVPLDGEVAWLTPQGRLPYWRGTITDITYQC
jgi:hypothetical protein